MCKVIKKKVISQEWGSGSEQSLGSKWRNMSRGGSPVYLHFQDHFQQATPTHVPFLVSSCSHHISPGVCILQTRNIYQEVPWDLNAVMFFWGRDIACFWHILMCSVSLNEWTVSKWVSALGTMGQVLRWPGSKHSAAFWIVCWLLVN
jgi:hypothetical protein